MVVIIPAYEPDKNLIKLVSDLKAQCNCKIVIIDDGSGKDYTNIFNTASELGASVFIHNKNQGKGAALKTAFSIVKNFDDSEEIVTADCDGQHIPKDILKVSECAKNNKNKLILGTRCFSKKVPIRSSLGNKITSSIFALINGQKISDTQTGLRGFSKNMIPWLSNIEGNGYEYEMNMLLEAKKYGYEIKEIPIETIYIGNNSSSHFNPLLDSIKIYIPILKFSMSSIICGALDFILLFLINSLTSNLLVSVVVARFFSSNLNYVMNKTYVFSNNKTTINRISFPRYFFLVLLVLTLNYILLNFIYILGINLFLAKIITEVTLFLFSFIVQKNFIFI